MTVIRQNLNQPADMAKVNQEGGISRCGDRTVVDKKKLKKVNVKM